MLRVALAVGFSLLTCVAVSINTSSLIGSGSWATLSTTVPSITSQQGQARPLASQSSIPVHASVKVGSRGALKLEEHSDSTRDQAGEVATEQRHNGVAREPHNPATWPEESFEPQHNGTARDPYDVATWPDNIFEPQHNGIARDPHKPKTWSKESFKPQHNGIARGPHDPTTWPEEAIKPRHDGTAKSPYGEFGLRR